MHILIIPSWYPHAPDDISGVFFREQALALNKQGVKVGVIYPQLRSLKKWKSVFSGPYGLSSEIDEGMPTVRYHNMNWFPRTPSTAEWQWVKHGMSAYNRYVDEYGKPDIIHVHSILFAGCLAKKLYTAHGIPFIITEHFSGYARGSISKRNIDKARLISKHAKVRLAVSESFCRQLELVIGTPTKTWSEIPNIVHERFTRTPLSPLRETKQFHFICVALLSENKCIHNAIHAFKLAFSDTPQVSMSIGGNGPELPRLKTIVDELGLSQKITFLGKLSRDRVLEEISNSDVFVLPSRFETFGVVVIEALALGKPVIATRCGGPDSIVEEKDGILVPTDDIKSLADAMLKMHTNKKLYISDSIRQSCIKRFSEEAISKRLKLIYEKVFMESQNQLKNTNY